MKKGFEKILEFALDGLFVWPGGEVAETFVYSWNVSDEDLYVAVELNKRLIFYCLSSSPVSYMYSSRIERLNASDIKPDSLIVIRDSPTRVHAPDLQRNQQREL